MWQTIVGAIATGVVAGVGGWLGTKKLVSDAKVELKVRD